MSKKVKSLIERDLKQAFDGLDSVAVISARGIDANKNNAFRRELNGLGLKMTVVKNTLAARAGQGTGIQGFEKLLEQSSAVVYGKGESISGIARMLVDARKKYDGLELRGIFFDGENYFGDDGVEKVSKFPTREEAIANLAGALMGPGRKLAAAIKGPGSKLVGVLKTIEEKQGGETA
ncbi:MAG: 50S ribosomal protein L10 [Phycisphaerae bacterium]